LLKKFETLDIVGDQNLVLYEHSQKIVIFQNSKATKALSHKVPEDEHTSLKQKTISAVRNVMSDILAAFPSIFQTKYFRNVI